MKYEWEDEISTELLQEIDFMLPPGLELAGIAVWNGETVEGALVEAYDLPHGIAVADIAQDILGDAEALYQKSYEQMTDEWEVRRGKRGADPDA